MKFPSFFTILGLTSALHGVSFTVTEYQGSELTLNNASTDYGASTTLNSLESFKYTRDGGAEIQSSSANFQAVIPAGITAQYAIQPRTDPNTTRTGLYTTREDYMTAGANGLSLSTGINLTTNDPFEVWEFRKIFLDNNGVGDNVPDFLVADVAHNQSDDRWEFVDDQGSRLLYLDVPSAKWNQLGKVDLDRYDFTNDTVTSFNGRKIYGLALELSEFKIDDGDGNLANDVNVTSADVAILNAIDDLKVTIPGADPLPRTDYGWIASNTDTIQFEQQVPEPTTTFLSLLAGVSLLSRRKRL